MTVTDICCTWRIFNWKDSFQMSRREGLSVLSLCITLRTMVSPAKLRLPGRNSARRILFGIDCPLLKMVFALGSLFNKAVFLILRQSTTIVSRLH